MGGQPRVQVYVTTVYRGQNYQALLDTGSDVTIMGVKSLPGVHIKKTRQPQQLYAVKHSAVHVSGTASVNYLLNGRKMHYNILASKELEEIIFGSDWLKAHNCIWDFNNGNLFLREGETTRQIPLLTAPCTTSV